MIGCETWLSIHLDMLCVLFVTVVVFAALATQSGAGMNILYLPFITIISFFCHLIIGLFLSQPIRQSFSQSVSQSVSQPIGQPVIQKNKSANNSANKSDSQTV